MRTFQKNNAFSSCFIPCFILLVYFFSFPLDAAIPAALVNNKALQSVDAGRLSEEMSLPSSPLAKPNLSAPSIQQEEQTSIPDADKVFFILEHIDFVGNQVFSAQELQEIFEPLLHKRVSIAQILQEVERITQKYRAQGYFLSKAIFPPQSIQNGKITIQVIEGFINRITIEEIPDQQKPILEKYARSIMNSKPLKYEDLERYLLLVNDITGFEVRSIISPDPTVPQAAQLTLIGRYTSVNASLTYDNYGTRYVGPNKATATASFNSLLIPEGTTALRYTTAQHAKELQFFELKHDQALGTEGMHWSVGASRTDTQPQYDLSQFGIKGTNQNLFTTFSYPLIRSRQQSLRANLGFNYMNVYSSTFGEQLYDDKIREFTLGAGYENFLWNGINLVNFNVHQGISMMGSSHIGETSRVGARSNFRKYTLSLSRHQFFDDVFSLFVMGTSQYTKSSMFSAEEFIFGGPSLGRGYDAAQFSGDKGLAGKTELRATTKPGFKVLEKIQYYAFYDVGAVWNINKASATYSRSSGASAGIGIRTIMTSHFNADLFLAKPLTTPNNIQKLTGANGNAPLFYFQISTTW